MRRRKLIWQLYPAFLAVTIGSLLLVSWYGSAAVKKFHLEQIANHLESKAYLAADVIAPALAKGDLQAVRSFCREIGKRIETRLTVISPAGTVLGDTEEEPERMENHADRPEVIAARQGKIEPAIRFSSTLHKEMLYVAIPLTKDAEILGVLRTAVSISSIDEALRTIEKRIFLGALLITAFVAYIAWNISRRLSRPLEEMRRGVERFARGDFRRKLASCGTEEISSLATSINEMAHDLDSRMQAVLSQRNELESVFSSMVEGVMVFDRRKRLLSLNKAGAELFGVREGNIVGKTILEVVRNMALQDFVEKTLQSAGSLEGEIELNTPKGDRFFQTHGTSLKSLSGETIGGLIVINDVTTLRRLENMRRDFVANVSHELKTPITSIQGFVETLLDGAMDDAEHGRKFLKIIARQAGRLSAIIEDLLMLSRIESMEEAAFRREEQELRKVLLAAVQACEMKAAQKEISLEIECGGEIRGLVNPQLLEQAVVNLIDNAIKYGPPKSRVLASCEQRGAEILLQVKDNGPGIPQEHQARIFERFYRIDKARSKEAGGTGLGLAIVNHIAQIHGGKVGVTSILGRGSVFTIRLPGRLQDGEREKEPAP